MGSESDGEGEDSNGLTSLPLVMRPQTCPLAVEENMDDDPLLETFMDKIFYDLSWSEVKAHWSVGTCLHAIVFFVLPCYWDIGSDVWLGITFFINACDCPAKRPDYIWGSLTLMLVFLPGAQLYSFKGWVLNKAKEVEKKWQYRWILACVFFPVTLVCFKASLLFSQTPKMTGMNIRITACEAASESILQLSLQLFIIFQRAQYDYLQVATILSSLIITSLGETENFLQTKMNKMMEQGLCTEWYTELGIRQRWFMIAEYLPFHIFLTIFRVTSFSLILVVLGVYSILLYTALVFLLIPLGVMRAVVKDPRFTGLLDYLSWVTENKGMVYLITLPFRTILSTGNADLQSETIFQIFWFICNITSVAILNFLVNLHLSNHKFELVSSFYDFLKLDDVEIIKNTLAFNAIIGTILISGSVTIVLYFLQIRKCLERPVKTTSSSCTCSLSCP